MFSCAEPRGFRRSRLSVAGETVASQFPNVLHAATSLNRQESHFVRRQTSLLAGTLLIASKNRHLADEMIQRKSKSAAETGDRGSCSFCNLSLLVYAGPPRLCIRHDLLDLSSSRGDYAAFRPSCGSCSFLEFLLPDIFDRPVIAVFGGADIFRLAFTSSYLRADT